MTGDSVVVGASLSAAQLWKLIKEENLISPWPTEDEVGDGTIDLRLSDLFLLSKRSSVASVHVERPGNVARLFTELRVRHDSTIVLQPGQFILATTLQYLALPPNVSGQIQSRSTIGRMGVVAVAAPYVAPGFIGAPTLEIKNVGEISVELSPFGEALCHIILARAESSLPRPSRYQCSTRPVFARSRAEDVEQLWGTT